MARASGAFSHMIQDGALVERRVLQVRRSAEAPQAAVPPALLPVIKAISAAFTGEISCARELDLQGLFSPFFPSLTYHSPHFLIDGVFSTAPLSQRVEMDATALPPG